MKDPTPDHVIVFMDDQKRNNESHGSHLKNISSKTIPPLSPPRNKTPCRLSFSKPKARFIETSQPVNQKFIPEHQEFERLNMNVGSDYESSGEEEEYYMCDEQGRHIADRFGRKSNVSREFVVEWILFIIISASLVCSLTIPSLKNRPEGGLELWRWCLMILVVFSGRLVSGWIIRMSVFFIERNFMLREKVLYFVYGLRKSIRNCVWLGLVLLSWTFVFSARVHKNNRLIKKVFQSLVAVLIGATIWLIKILLVKIMASSFHVTTYFDRMKESVFHHYVLDALSGPPMDVLLNEKLNTGMSQSLPTSLSASKSLSNSRRGKIDIEILRTLSRQSTASAWTVKRLINYVRSFGLSTISRTVDEGLSNSEITSEWEARQCAKRIFNHVAKPGAKYIEEDDLMRFLKRIEIHTIFPLLEGAIETGKITKSAFSNWVVRAYYERKSLKHSLNDTKTAVQQLHKLASVIVSVIITVETVMVMGLASTKVVAVIITQLLLLGFTFHNMCKTIFESIVFVFVMHPYDIGDRCVIDGVQMVVEEMNILTTVFLRYDNEKIYYPNASLITKPISNFYRSPEMGDAINFTIDTSTSFETINALKKAIQKYIESKPKYWNPKHSLVVNEIENVDKMKMSLGVLHTINHQNYGDKTARMSELLFELKKIFENLDIKYHLLPQEIHITQVNTIRTWTAP